MVSEGIILGSQFFKDDSMISISQLPYRDHLDLKPIPITTKKLSDLGFRRIGKSRDWVYNNVFIHRRIRGWVTKKTEPELRFIHELQLYVYCKTRKLIKL
jgi:hypothetical protein